MMHKKISGIIPPMVTPFHDDGTMNLSVLQSETRRLLSAGVHGLSFGGSTGEGALLSDAELENGLTAIRESVGNEVPLLCGIIRNSTMDGISAAKAAKRGGADYLMITPTYYHGTNEEGNFVYFDSIYEETQLPIIIYNVIKNNPITPDMMPRLSEIKGLVGIKQSVGGIHALVDMVAACGSKLTVFGAQDDVMYLSYLAGAGGAISAIISLFPNECVQQWIAVQQGNINKARLLNDRMLPVWRAIEGGAFPGRIKTALQLMGIDVGHARSPILPTDRYTQDKILRELKKSGFISS